MIPLLAVSSCSLLALALSSDFILSFVFEDTISRNGHRSLSLTPGGGFLPGLSIGASDLPRGVVGVRVDRLRSDMLRVMFGRAGGGAEASTLGVAW